MWWYWSDGRLISIKVFIDEQYVDGIGVADQVDLKLLLCQVLPSTNTG